VDRDFYVSVAGSAQIAPIVASNGNQFVTHFEWSPNGNQLAFTANLDLQSQVELYVINRDGTGLISVSDGVGNEQVSTAFAWSPDSTQIALSAGISPSNPTTVYIAEADGSGVARISDPLISDIGQIAYISN
jgi:Tol biopolymer transport system component